MDSRRFPALGISVLLVCLTLAGLSTGGRIPSSAQGMQTGAAQSVPRPGVYIARDYSNLDPSEWPIVGGYNTYSWKQLEPNEGEYRWDIIEGALAAMSAKGKPAGIHMLTYAGAAGGLVVPSWFQSSHADAIITCSTEKIPKYWHSAYIQHYGNFIRAMAARFDGDPRLEFVIMGVGVYGETQPCVEQYDECMRTNGLSGALWVSTVKQIVDIYGQAFHNTRVMIPGTPRFMHVCERKEWTDYAAATYGIGDFHAAMQADADSQYIPDKPGFEGCGALDPLYRWSLQYPTGQEAYQYMTPSEAETYWGVLGVLSRHNTWLCIDYSPGDWRGWLLADASGVPRTYNFPFMEFANRYLGRTLQDTPSVWTAMRESGYTYYPECGNFNFWLYQDDSVAGGKTVVVTYRTGLNFPTLTSGCAITNKTEQGVNLGGSFVSKESWIARRTDSASGNRYMFFKVDDGYVFDVNQAITVTVTYFDRGTDRWELFYDSTTGQRSGGSVNKTNSQTWKKAVLVLANGRFANSLTGGSDFYIDGGTDGDEYIHFVDVTKSGGTGPTSTPTATAGPTATPTNTPTRTPTHTTGPSPTPTDTPTRTPTATPTATTGPAPVSTTVTFQQGAVGYTGAADTYISDYADDSNYNWDELLTVRSTDITASLLRFDVSSIPSNATVLSAQLQLYTIGQSNSAYMCARPYAVLRPWIDSQATWNRATSADLWAIPGCNGIGTDRTNVGGQEVWLQYSNTWYSFDIAGIVQAWVLDPDSNRGLAMKSTCNMAEAVQYTMAASNYSNTSLRPKLVVQYTLEGTPPTRTFTPAPTTTATPTPSTPPTTLTLQQGLNGYAGTEDTLIDWWSKTTNYGNEGTFNIRGGNYDYGRQDIHSALVKFGLSSLPAGASVNSARLEIYLTARSNDGSAYFSPYQAVRSWTELGATWNKSDASTDWSLAGCNQIPNDRLGDATDKVQPPPGATNVWISMDVTAIVRNWAADGQSNKGFLLHDEGGNSVGYTFASSENASASIRPRLVIEYWPGSGASATPTRTASATPTRTPTATPTPQSSATATPTATASPTPTALTTATTTPTATATPTLTATPSATATSTPGGPVQTVQFQFGVSGYTGSADTHLDSWLPTSNFAASTSFSVRTYDVMAGLLHFDLPGIPSNAEIVSATLTLYASYQSNGNQMDITLHRVLRQWVDTQANWQKPRDSLPQEPAQQWEAAGCNGTTYDRTSQAYATLHLDAAYKSFTIDVGDLVRHWVSHPEENFGMVFKGAQGGSVEYRFASAEYSDADRRPVLRVAYANAGQTATSTPTPTPTPTATPLAQAVQIALVEGWNLISIPLAPDNNDPAVIFAPIADSLALAYFWDAQAGAWKTYDPALPPAANTLTTVNERMGLWLGMTSAATLAVSGQAPATTQIPLYAGWNMVGFPASTPRDTASALASLSDKITAVLGYDPESQGSPWKRYRPAAPPFANDLTVLEPGRAYWILATEDCSWAVAY